MRVSSVTVGLQLERMNDEMSAGLRNRLMIFAINECDIFSFHLKKTLCLVCGHLLDCERKMLVHNNDEAALQIGISRTITL